MSTHPVKPFSPPARSFRDNLRITPDEVVLGSADGHWPNATIYFDATVNLAANTGELRVYVSTEGGTRSLVRAIPSADIPWVSKGSGRNSAAIQVNGWPGDRWEITYVGSPVGVLDTTARCTVEYWGTEASCCGTEGDASTVVEGDAVVDVTHAPPTNAINGRDQIYGWAVDSRVVPPVVGDPIALASPLTPEFHIWNTGTAGNVPGPLLTASIGMGVDNGTSFAAANRLFSAGGTFFGGPTLANVYGTNTAQVGFSTQATLVGVTGSVFRRVQVDAANNGLVVNVRGIDYDNLDRRPLLTPLGKQVVIEGLPVPSDPEDKPPFYLSTGVVTAVARDAPCVLMSLQVSVQIAAPP